MDRHVQSTDLLIRKERSRFINACIEESDFDSLPGSFGDGPGHARRTTGLSFAAITQLTGVSQSNVPTSLKQLWTYEAGESIESSAAIVGGTVFVGSQKGELVALSLDNGSVYWKFSTGSPIGESSPAYGSGVVYIGDLGGWLNAVNASDGKKMWAFKTGGEIKSSPVVVGDRVLIGSYDEHLYCLSARNGSVLWKFKTNGPVHSTPGIADGMAFIAGCDEVFRAIRISDGKEVFSVSSGAYTGASPALRGGAAFYGTFDNEVLGVNLAERKIAWRYEHPQRKFPFYSSAAVTAIASRARWARQAGPWINVGWKSCVDVSRRARALNRRRQLREGECLSARTMDGFMF